MCLKKDCDNSGVGLAPCTGGIPEWNWMPAGTLDDPQAGMYLNLECVHPGDCESKDQLRHKYMTCACTSYPSCVLLASHLVAVCPSSPRSGIFHYTPNRECVSVCVKGRRAQMFLCGHNCALTETYQTTLLRIYTSSMSSKDDCPLAIASPCMMPWTYASPTRESRSLSKGLKMNGTF